MKTLQVFLSFLRPNHDQAVYDAVQRFLSEPGKRLTLGSLDVKASDIRFDRTKPVQAVPVPGAHGVEVVYTPCTVATVAEQAASSFWLKTTLVDGMVTAVHLSEVSPAYAPPEEIEHSSEPRPMA